ncbi:MAG TPA: M28 family peptidase [Solirubrobacteraceae bacterium]|nr:M28 family peptidase [Solirubrobacteraceae bacterium]
MQPIETTAGLTRFENRGPGTDAERRAGRWLAGELVASRHRVRIETFWCRPNWALAHAWHVALALAGSLLAVGHPTIGAVLLAIALISALADATVGVSPGRRLSPERASQNIIASATRATAFDQNDPRARLIITANYDAGRTGLIYRDALRRTAARIRRATNDLAPGWHAWLAIAIAYELAVAIVRVTTHHPSSALGAIQLPPTVALVLALALLLEAAAASYGPAAGDNAAGTAVAVELTRALAADPPKNLTVELVLQGAGEDEQLGLRKYLRNRKKELTQSNAIVLGIAACGTGRPRYWISDGRLIPLRYASSLRNLAADAGITPHRGRGATPALPARATGLPAIAIGCLDRLGLAPRSHQQSDTPDTLDEAATDDALMLGLTLARAIDASLTPGATNAETTPTPA